MSHQLVITFDLDETKVQENAEKEAGRQIARQVIDEVFGHGYDAKNQMRKYVYRAIREILEQDKEEIVAGAINEVVGGLSRTKMVKEKFAEALDGKEGS